MEREPTPRERWRLEREAVLDSRPAKERRHSAAALHEGWRMRLRALGLEPHELVVNAVGRARSPTGIDREMMLGMIDGALEAIVTLEGIQGVLIVQDDRVGVAGRLPSMVRPSL